MPHINDNIDMTVEVFIVYNSSVLLRKHDKYGIWLSVGGHIELNEDPNEAALREVKEEVGLDIRLYHESQGSLTNYWNHQELVPPQFMNRHRINNNHEHVTFVYFARSTSDKLILSDKERSSACTWFTANDIKQSDEIKPSVRFYATEALRIVESSLNN